MKRVKEQLTFFLSFLKDKDVGSVTPTSPFGVKKICDKMDFARDIVVVEYGPGTGVITREVLKRMSRGSRLILIEQNGTLADLLRESLTDPRVKIIQGSAEDVRKILTDLKEPHADYVISGIPFQFFSKEPSNKIVADTHAVLTTGGAFLVYQFRRIVGRFLRRHFAKVTQEFEARNIPPLTIFEARK